MLILCEYICLAVPCVILALTILVFLFYFKKKNAYLRVIIYSNILLIIFLVVSSVFVIYTFNRYTDNKIDFGMKKQEIIDVLGKPYKEIYLSPSSETLWYVIHLIPFKFNMAITLENGVVVEMGQITDERIEKYLEAEDDPIFSMLNQFFKAFLLI